MQQPRRASGQQQPRRSFRPSAVTGRKSLEGAGSGSSSASSPPRKNIARNIRSLTEPLRAESPGDAVVEEVWTRLCVDADAMLQAHHDCLNQVLNSWSDRQEGQIKRQQSILDRCLILEGAAKRIVVAGGLDSGTCSSPAALFKPQGLDNVEQNRGERTRPDNAESFSMTLQSGDDNGLGAELHRPNAETKTSEENPEDFVPEATGLSLADHPQAVPESTGTPAAGGVITEQMPEVPRVANPYVDASSSTAHMSMEALGVASTTSTASIASAPQATSGATSNRWSLRKPRLTSRASKAAVSPAQSFDNVGPPASSTGKKTAFVEAEPTATNSSGSEPARRRQTVMKLKYSVLARPGANGGKSRSKSQQGLSDMDEDDDEDDDEESREASKEAVTPRLSAYQRFADLVNSPFFDLISGIAILANGLTIGLEADYSTTHTARSPVFMWIQNIFNFWYLTEIILRIIAEGGLRFFYSKNWRWNLFDVGMMTLVVFEVCLDQFTAGSAVMGRFLRTLRVLRVVRTMRIMRLLRYIREFRKMIFAIAATMSTLMWAMLLLCIFMYMFSICFTQGVADWIKEDEEKGRVADEAARKALTHHWGSILESMNSLYMSISGGISWGIVSEPLLQVHWSLVILFLMFVTLSLFGVLNVVTAIFVESALHSTKHYRDLLLQEKMHEKETYAKHMREVFNQIDVDGSGEINCDEMEHFLADDHLRSYLEALEIDLVDSRCLFKLLDYDDSGVIDINEFCEGCLRLKGEAKSFDIHYLLYENHKMNVKWSNFMDHVEDRLDYLHLNCCTEDWNGQSLHSSVS